LQIFNSQKINTVQFNGMFQNKIQTIFIELQSRHRHTIISINHQNSHYKSAINILIEEKKSFRGAACRVVDSPSCQEVKSDKTKVKKPTIAVDHTAAVWKCVSVWKLQLYFWRYPLPTIIT
jgi:hypothetical protein